MTEALTIIRGAQPLDVRTGELADPSDVLVRGSQIMDVTDTHASTTLDANVIHASGLTVMPGLIDGHVHATAVTADLAAQAEWSANYVAALAATQLKAMLARGFTTVRDVGGADYGLAAAIEEGHSRGPRVVFGGKALSQSGGHGDMRHRGRQLQDDHPCCPNIAVVCDGVDEVRRTARDQLRTGARHLKLMLSGGVASPTDAIEDTQFSIPEIKAAVEEAAAVGAYVAGHAYTARSIERALEAGVRSIEHGNLLDEHSIELFLKHSAFYVPTLVTYDRLAKEGIEFGLPPASYAKVATVYDKGLAALEMAHRAGVNVVFGTDLLGGMQKHQLDEFRLRSEVQPAADVIRSATVTAARLLGMEATIGCLDIGATADVILLSGNPVEDIDVLLHPNKNLRLVMKSGAVLVNNM